MSTVYLLHGFNVKDGGAGSTGKLRAGLERAGHTVKEIKYGWFQRVRVRMCNSSIARVLASMADKDSILIAHSNGCAIAYAAAKFGAPFRHVFLINPALDAKLEIPHVEKVHVFYALSDPWTKLARWIPWSPWGRQGAVGFTGTARAGKYKQTELDELAGEEVGHSGIFNHTRKLLSIITGEIHYGKSNNHT